MINISNVFTLDIDKVIHELYEIESHQERLMGLLRHLMSQEKAHRLIAKIEVLDCIRQKAKAYHGCPLNLDLITYLRENYDD